MIDILLKVFMLFAFIISLCILALVCILMCIGLISFILGWV